MNAREFLRGVCFTSSPYWLGGAVWAFWQPFMGSLIAVGATVGMAWVLAMCRAAGGNDER